MALLCRWIRTAVVAGLILLATAVLTKGPVAVVLTGMTLVLFAITRRDLAGLWRRLRPLPGLLITAAISLPWYIADCWWKAAVLGQLFGYHNLQRLTSVVMTTSSLVVLRTSAGGGIPAIHTPVAARAGTGVGRLLRQRFHRSQALWRQPD